MKKVRKTVDYLHENSPNLIAVINTTGNPYYQRQLLRDVVVWYGLSQGISNGILKEVGGSIQAFSFDDKQTDQLLDHVISDFFKDYGHVRLPDGAPAKLAVYFPQTDDLQTCRPAIEAKLTSLGLPTSLILENHTKAPQADIDAFARLNDPAAPHRVILLVNKGTEGWNCPSLFACALARKLRISNNFVLQAASRCLRQAPGNTHKARIYHSADNYGVLDRQLQETFGETLSDVNRSRNNSRRTIIRLRKLDLPPLIIKQIIRTVSRKTPENAPLMFKRPDTGTAATIEKKTYTVAEQRATFNVLRQVGDAEQIATLADAHTVRELAVDISANYHLDVWTLHDALAAIYPEGEIPATHIDSLAAQIEEQTAAYEVTEETVEVALALVRPEGFDHSLSADGNDVYTAEISYPIDKESLFAAWEDWKDKAGEFGFHYTP